MHAIIAGMTEVGKTTLAKAIAKSVSRVAVFECDVRTPWENVVFHTTNIDLLLKFSQSNKNCNIFIDDSEEATDRDRSYNFFATRARHYGHRCFFIMQRPTQVLPTVRNNCGAVYLFRINPVDAQQLAIDYNEPMLANAPTLEVGEFFCKNSPTAKCTKFKLSL
jgi:DNA helicase HerA-like ATPase